MASSSREINHPQSSSESSQPEFIIGDEDYLSNLPDDLIRPIFEMFDYEKLDVIGQVSRKMFHFATFAKQKVKKKEMEGLRIRQKHNGDFFINMRNACREYKVNYKNFYMIVKIDSSGNEAIRKGRYYYYKEPEEIIEDHSDDYVMPWMTEVPKLCKRRSVPLSIYKGIEYLLNRFSCRKIDFEAVLIDDAFMSSISPTIGRVNNLVVSFCHTVPERIRDKGHTKRFLKWVVSLKPKSFRLTSIPDNMVDARYGVEALYFTGDVYDSFLKTLSEVAPNTEVILPNDAKFIRVFPCEVRNNAIIKLKYAYFPGLVLDVNSTIEITRRRFIRWQKGKLHLSTPRKVTGTELIDGLGNDFEVLSHDITHAETFIMRLRDTIYSAKIILMDCDYVDVSFYENFCH